MTTFTFKLNEAGVRKIATGPKVRELVDDATARTLQHAKSNGDINDEYRESLRAEPSREVDGQIVGEVIADTPFWHFFEFGTIYHGPYRVLSRAARAAGLTFKES